MRSSRNALALGVAVGLALAGCGTEVKLDTTGDAGVMSPDAESCATSYVTYQTVGEPFMSNWCRGCHSAKLPTTMRQQAPVTVNFDTLADVRSWSERIAFRATGKPPTMPPSGGPSDEERSLLAGWLACGAP